MGAQGAGARSGHAGAHAQGAGLVGGGGDDSASGRAAHDDGAANEAGVLAHLDLGEEGVHVNVEDRGGRVVRTPVAFGARVPGSV